MKPAQYSDPLRVVMFNTDTDRAEDVSHAIAQEILRRLDPSLMWPSVTRALVIGW
jgi:hypothetical protein